jgi:serine/threonine protein kinase
MEHLAEMKFIHRDLAARNCLLFAFSEEDVRVTSVKVSDFGLTVRKNYNQTYAVGVEGEARPLRWLAPEALRFNRFSEKTDVFSLGTREHIEGGCPDDAWQIITVCVDKDPKRRPRFSELLPMLMLSVNGTGFNPVFLGYRVSSDSQLAERLYDKLVSKGLKVASSFDRI